MPSITTKNRYYVVINLKGTSGLKCGCGSWLAHWRHFTGSQRATCAVLGCGQTASVGAHVLLPDRRSNRQWWIAPFCFSHNHHKNEDMMLLNANITLVSANRSYTCR